MTRELNWELLMKKGSVTLRPIGEAPTLRKWLLRFVFLGGPITFAFALAFRDLAGEGSYDQGLRVGIVLGMLLSDFSHRTENVSSHSQTGAPSQQASTTWPHRGHSMCCRRGTALPRNPQWQTMFSQ